MTAARFVVAPADAVLLLATIATLMGAAIAAAFVGAVVWGAI